MTLTFATMFSQVTQQIRYPRFEVDSLGQKIVIMTIPQAMKLNSNSNILKKSEQLEAEMQDYENMCIKVVNEKDEVITKLNVVITKQDQQLIIKDEKIKALQEEILAWIQKNKVLESQLSNRQEVIDEKDKQTKRLKLKMVVGGVSSAAIIIPLVLKVIGVIK